MDPNKKDTQSIARNHIIEVSDGNLVTIAGGEFTLKLHTHARTHTRTHTSKHHTRELVHIYRPDF